MIEGLIFKFYDCMFIYMVKCKPKLYRVKQLYISQ